MADEKFAKKDYPATIVYLETVLSAIHDLVDGLAMKLTIGNEARDLSLPNTELQ